LKKLFSEIIVTLVDVIVFAPFPLVVVQQLNMISLSKPLDSFASISGKCIKILMFCNLAYLNVVAESLSWLSSSLAVFSI